MALRKRGKSDYYYSYYRGLDERPDGTLVAVMREVCLHTSDATTAAALDHQLREREAARRASLRARAFARQLLDGGTDAPAAPEIAHEHRRPRLRLADALDVAAKYGSVGQTLRVVWGKFARECGARYMDEITPQRVHAYLSGYERGKTYNNVRGCINRVYVLTRMESGVDVSPADAVPTRRNDSRHQRELTEDEFVRLYNTAPEPWHTAVLIGWHTGMREEDVFSLRWDQIVNGNIEKLPGKTAAYGRSVQIPIHWQLQQALDLLPHVGPYLFSAWCPDGRVRASQRDTWRDLRRKLGIESNAFGLAKFNSLRNNAATRFDENAVPRHATQGVLGHASERMTNLYSHDLKSAQKILDLPPAPVTVFAPDPATPSNPAKRKTTQNNTSPS